MKDIIKTIGITETTKSKIKRLSEKYGYADITVLEYLLRGDIPLEELKRL